MKKSVVTACLLAVLAIGGAVVWAASGGGDAAGERAAKKSTPARDGQAGQSAGSATGASQEPAATLGAATAGGAPAVAVPSIPLPADAEQAKKVAALNEVIVAVTQEAMKRPAGERMTQEQISELIRTRIRGVIPEQDTKGASQGNP